MGLTQRWTGMKESCCLLSIIINILVFCCQRNGVVSYEIKDVKELVREWSPLVWLAPGEKYMPMDVDEFLKNVHPERLDPRPHVYDLNEHPEKYAEYYNDIKELQEIQVNLMTNRIKRNFKNPVTFLDGLPVGEDSEKWLLVTNTNLDTLRRDEDSFIYGKDPNRNPVPVYAVVSPCSEINPIINEVTLDRRKYKIITDTDKNRYIPLQARSLRAKKQGRNLHNPLVSNDTKVEIVMAITVTEATTINETQPLITNQTQSPSSSSIDSSPPLTTVNSALNTPVSIDRIGQEVSEVVQNSVQPVLNDNKWAIKENEDWKPSTFNLNLNKGVADTDTFNNFHVTYWMFYPYSQGKAMCSIDLGPFGPVPIPLIFGFCFGERKEFGSHVGDWEHVSLHFKNNQKEPSEMYVSAHDAGAYYTYNPIVGLFEFKKQETRKGIFQKPSFPKTVMTSKNHPVLFSAEGSHGLWTAPGKHRYVRVPRLYDINGFGIPWTTWDNIKIFFSDRMDYDKSTPSWLKFRGKWGNQRSKCHPLTRVGLHLCEISDGPTGIPRKKPHFQCTKQLKS